MTESLDHFESLTENLKLSPCYEKQIQIISDYKGMEDDRIVMNVDK